MNDYNNDLYKYFAYRFLMIALLAIFSVSGYANDCLTELKKNFPNMEFIKPSYAQNFELYRNKVKSSDFTFLKINKLWIGDKLGKDYFISNNPPKKLKELKSCHRVKLINNKNLKRIIPLSTTYVAFLEALKLEQTIISFPNTKFINSPRSLALIKKGKIKNLKFPLSTEEIISHSPDLIISYSSSSPEILGLEKIERLTSKIVFFPEYLEVHPLARTEWILVLGYLMNKVPAATSFFNKVKKNYLSYKSKRPVSKKKIKVLLGSKSNGDWQAPKKLSYLGILVEDAGGENLLTKNLRTEQSFSFENILKLKKNVDIWLPHTTWQNKKEMIKEDSKYSLLINNSQIDIYNASKKSSAIAGYDFWETGLSRPDLILKDLQSIFRKTIKGELRWYQKL